MTKLSKSEISLLSIRLLALYLISVGLGSFISSLMMAGSALIAGERSQTGTFLVMSSATLPHFFIGVALWIKASKIARWLLPNTERENTGEPPLSYETVCAIALAILGLWILSYSLPDLINVMTYRFIIINEIKDQLNYNLSGSSIIDVKASNSAAMVKSISESLFGLWLLLGSNFFITLFKKVRAFGKE